MIKLHKNSRQTSSNMHMCILIFLYALEFHHVNMKSRVPVCLIKVLCKRVRDLLCKVQLFLVVNFHSASSHHKKAIKTYISC